LIALAKHSQSDRPELVEATNYIDKTIL
jgi:hypothetical protein